MRSFHHRERREQPEVVDGEFPLPNRPGLGIEVSDEALAEYSVGTG